MISTYKFDVIKTMGQRIAELGLSDRVHRCLQQNLETRRDGK